MDLCQTMEIAPTHFSRAQSEILPAKLLKDNLSECFDVKENVNSDFALYHFNKTICFKVVATDMWYFGILCESLEESPVQNFRSHFLTKTDLKSFIKLLRKLQQWNKQTVLVHYCSFIKI